MSHRHTDTHLASGQELVWPPAKAFTPSATPNTPSTETPVHSSLLHLTDSDSGEQLKATLTHSTR